MGENRNYSLLPNVALLKIFQFSKLEDLYYQQKACPKFKQQIEDLKRKEIENDWRLDYLKYEKFGPEISATGAVKSLQLAKTKKGGKYSLNGRLLRFLLHYGDTIDCIDMYHNTYIFTEVSNYSLVWELIHTSLVKLKVSMTKPNTTIFVLPISSPVFCKLV